MGKEIEKQQPAALAPLPAHLIKEGEHKPRGGEMVERGDVTLPRLGLCQSLSPQRKRGEPEYIPGLEEGMFFNTITKEIYGEFVIVVPLFFYKTRMFFKKGGGLSCQAVDAKHGVGNPGGNCNACPKAKWGDEEGEPPECYEMFNYPLLVMPKRGRPTLESLAVLSLKSTGARTAKDWNARLGMRTMDDGKGKPVRLDWFAAMWKLTSAEAKNDVGSWYKVVINASQDTIPNISVSKDHPGLLNGDVYQFSEGAYTSMKELQTADRLDFDVRDLNVAREPGDENPNADVA